jgi:hypothetical protein
MKSTKSALRLAGVLSVVGAGFDTLIGGAYLLVGYESLQVFLRD